MTERSSISGEPAPSSDAYGNEKITGYCAELFALLASHGTGLTSTFTVVWVANGTWPRPVNVTTFCSAGLIDWIDCVFTIGLDPFTIVSVTGMLASRKLPESCTVTANARSVVAVTVFRLVVESVCPAGSALTETTFVPCRPEQVPPVDAPRSRWSTSAIECGVTRSLVATCDCGTATPLTCSSAI